MNTWQYTHIKQYLTLMKKAFAHCKAGGEVQLFWSSQPVDLKGFRREFITALNRRINAKVPQKNTNKMAQDYQTGLLRDSRNLQDIINHRRRIYQFETKLMQEKFGHKLSKYGNDFE